MVYFTGTHICIQQYSDQTSGSGIFSDCAIFEHFTYRCFKIILPNTGLLKRQLRKNERFFLNIFNIIISSNKKKYSTLLRLSWRSNIAIYRTIYFLSYILLRFHVHKEKLNPVLLSDISVIIKKNENNTLTCCFFLDIIRSNVILFAKQNIL